MSLWHSGELHKQQGNFSLLQTDVAAIGPSVRIM